MSNKKKRKNSNYDNKNIIAKEAARLSNEKKEKRKNIIIFVVSIVLLAALITGIIFAWTYDKSGEMGTGACEYLETRSIEGRDIKYVEMCVEGYGRLVILLDATTAPITVANFIELVEEKFYDGLTFHRVLDDFMIQGGDPKGNGQGSSENNIKGEFNSNGYANDIKHKYGVISMARGAYDMDSASCQFFICNSDEVSFLDGNYAAFGYVVEGMSVIDEITEKTAKYTVNDVISDKSKQPVIKYIKMLDSWEKP